MLSPYVTARYTVYWEFPTEAERLALVPEEVEVGRVAWQKDDNTFYFLVAASPIEWSSMGGAGGPAVADAWPEFVADSETLTIPLRHQYIVHQVFYVEGTLDIQGSLVIL